MNRQRFYIGLIVCCMWLAACGPSEQKQATAIADTTAIIATDTGALADDGYTPDAEYETMYIVIADTAQSYYSLQHTMYQLSGTLNIPVDTQGRHYNEEKDLIALADDDEDEMYRGDYYPRRSAGTNLSLEYYNMYDSITTAKNIALVSGQYENQKSADSLLSIIAPHAPHAFVRAASMYMGCMH